MPMAHFDMRTTRSLGHAAPQISIPPPLLLTLEGQLGIRIGTTRCVIDGTTKIKGLKEFYPEKNIVLQGEFN